MATGRIHLVARVPRQQAAYVCIFRPRWTLEQDSQWEKEEEEQKTKKAEQSNEKSDEQSDEKPLTDAEAMPEGAEAEVQMEEAEIKVQMIVNAVRDCQ
jgi:hypothetical protein